MAYCKNCGMPVDEKKDVRCPRCGEFVDGKKDDKNNSNKVIIAVLVAFVLIVAIFGIVLMVALNRDNDEHVEAVVSEQTETETLPHTVVASAGQEQTTVYNYSYDNSFNGNYYVPDTTVSKSGYTFIKGQNGFVSYNTPAHAGVKLRKYNDVDSEVIDILSEGTSLILAESITVGAESYAPVTVYLNGQRYNGYVLAKYITCVGGIADDGRGDEPVPEETPSGNSHYVSYNTPDSAGLNIRTEPTYYSDLVITLPEGTPVDVDFAGNDGSNEDYMYVGAYVDGQYYQGYVLSKYIE